VSQVDSLRASPNLVLKGIAVDDCGVFGVRVVTFDSSWTPTDSAGSALLRSCVGPLPGIVLFSRFLWTPLSAANSGFFWSLIPESDGAGYEGGPVVK